MALVRETTRRRRVYRRVFENANFHSLSDNFNDIMQIYGLRKGSASIKACKGRGESVFYRGFYILTMRLMSIDLWVLLKARQFTKILVKFLTSLFQVMFVMALGGGILIAYSLVNTGSEFESHGRLGQGKERLLRIEAASSAESSLLQEKLEKLKYQAISLELSLRKMKSQYNDLSKITSRSNYKEEELADFASEAAGGMVLDTPDTESYYESWHQQATLFGIPIWKANYFTPRKVIQPWTQAGECWAFKGSRGQIVIELAYRTLIDQVTLEHIPVSASLTGSISSAPRDLVLYGMVDDAYRKLGSFTYDINGSPSRIFKLKVGNKDGKKNYWLTSKDKVYPVKTVLLEILSNWGHRGYTCIYRFKVHGKLADQETEGISYIGGE